MPVLEKTRKKSGPVSHLYSVICVFGNKKWGVKWSHKWQIINCQILLLVISLYACKSKAEFDIRSGVTGILLWTCSYPLGIKTWFMILTFENVKKVVSDSLGLVDFGIGQVNSVLITSWWASDIFWGEFTTEVQKDKWFKFLINSCGSKPVF